MNRTRPALALLTLGLLSTRAASPEATTRDITILSYNIRNGGRRLDGVYDRPLQHRVALATQSDLVALQEVDRKTSRVEGADVPAEFAKALSMNFHYAPAIRYAGGEYGTAALSKFTIVRSATIPLPTPGENRAAALIVTKLADGGEVSFVSVHLDSSGKSDAQRLANTRALIAALEIERKTPVILAGDFNATPDSPIFSLLAEAGFRRCQAKPGAALSFPADKPRQLIDHVLLRDGATLRLEDAGTEVVNEPRSSDHRPLISHLRLVTKK